MHAKMWYLEQMFCKPNLRLHLLHSNHIKIIVIIIPYLLPSVGPGADDGVQAVSPQVTISHPPGGGLPLLSASLRLPSQPHSITAPWPLPSYTAWWQRHISVNNLPKVVCYAAFALSRVRTHDQLIASTTLYSFAPHYH